MTLNGILQRFDSIQTTDGLWTAFVDYMRGFGLDYCIYSFTPTPVYGVGKLDHFDNGAQGTVVHAVNRTNAPDEMVKIYLNAGAFRFDAVSAQAKVQQAPICFGPDLVSEDNPNRKKWLQLCDRLADLGIRTGFYLPMTNIIGRDHGGIGCYGVPDDPDFDPRSETLAPLVAACYAMHRKFLRLFVHEEAHRLDLSERQLRILRLVAVGASNREIADMMGITEATIAFHLKNAKAALQIPCNRAIPAAVFRLGLLNFLEP